VAQCGSCMQHNKHRRRPDRDQRRPPGVRTGRRAQPFRHRPRHVDRQRNLRARHDPRWRGDPRSENVSIYDLTIDAAFSTGWERCDGRGFQRHSREIRREPGRPGQQHHVQPDLHARHDQRPSWGAPPTIPNSPETSFPDFRSLTFQKYPSRDVPWVFRGR